MTRGRLGAWAAVGMGAVYFLAPLVATFEFSLRMRRGRYSFDAYETVFASSSFRESFLYSTVLALATIVVVAAPAFPAIDIDVVVHIERRDGRLIRDAAHDPTMRPHACFERADIDDREVRIGAAGERVGLVTARALSRPDFTNGMADSMVSNISGTCPATTSVSAGALPL